MKKTIGFYLSAVAAVLSLVSVFLYGSVSSANGMVRPLLIASVVVSVVVLGAGFASKSIPGGNLLPVLNSVLCMGAVGTATIPVISMIVFVAMGMNPYSTISAYVTFAVVAGIAWALDLISSFTGISK